MLAHSRLALLALLVSAAALTAAPASADVVPLDVEACTGRAAGSACVAGGTSGACQSSECTRLAYGDAATPTVVEYDCLRCVPGAPVGGGGCTASPGTTAAGSAALALLTLVAGLALTRRGGAR